MKRNGILITSVVLAICLLAGAVIAPLFGSKTPETQKSGTKTAESYEEIYERLTECSGGNGVFTYEEGAKVANAEIMMDEAESATAPTMAAVNSAGAEYSTTNTQVEGVDEGDIIKTDGDYIYQLRNGKLSIVDARSMKELCCIEVEGGTYSYHSEMFLSGDRLCIMATYQPQVLYYSRNCDLEYDGSCDTRTLLLFYDVSDHANPKNISTLTQSGNYISARMTGDILYTVSGSYIYNFHTFANVDKPETFIPTVGCFDAEKPVSCSDICLMEDFSEAAYTVVTSVKMSEAEQFDSVKSSFGGSGTVYANEKYLIVAANKYKEEEEETKINGSNAVIRNGGSVTELMLFSLDDGKIAPLAEGSIPGALLNQFAMDEKDGYFRFVTTEDRSIVTIMTDGIDSYDYSNSSSSGLYVLDKDLSIVGKIDGLADEERVQSVRFMGDTAYFVTFRNIDPLFSVDLSDPTSPKILSQLKIPGFSSYMHPYGAGRLFGLGYDADEETGMINGLKLTMFDISDPSNVTEKHTLKLTAGWSEATSNHKAILVSVDKNLIAFPSEKGYEVYGYDDGKGFEKKYGVDIENWMAYDSRGLFIGEKFFVCSGEAVDCFSLADFANLGRVELSFYDKED